MAQQHRYWFPAKRYGWGWGPPQTWEGWLVMLAFCGSIVAGVVLLLPSHGTLAFLGYAALLCVALVLVCWWKGEPPRWHWSGDSHDR